MVVVLDVHQLRILAEILLNKSIRLGGSDLTAIFALLELESVDHHLRHQFQGNNVKAPIADEIFSYCQMGVNSALQVLRNCHIRSSYFEKIMHVAVSMMTFLSTLDSADVEALEQLKEVPIAFKYFMLEQLEIMQLNRLQIALSPAFSVLLHELTFQQLVNWYVNESWELRGEPFESLSDNQKIQVYARIIEASGHGTLFLENLRLRDLRPAETELLLFTVGMMAWDIFSSHGVVDAALANLIQTGPAPGGAMLRQALGVADGEMLTDSALCVVMAGILNGSAGALVFGSFASRFVETFITSGGYPEIDPTDPHYYVAQTPDCRALVREIPPSPHCRALARDIADL